MAQLFTPLGIMDATYYQHMQEQSVKRRSLPMQLIALFIFLFVGGIFSWFVVLAEDGGEASGGFKSLVLEHIWCVLLGWGGEVYRAHDFDWHEQLVHFICIFVPIVNLRICAFSLMRLLGYILSKR